MEVMSTVEDLDEVTKKIAFSVPVERVAKEYNSSLSSVTKTARLKGFRPGKAPKEVVEKLMGDRIKLDVMNRLINEALRSAAETHKLDVIGDPELDVNPLDREKPFEFSAKVYLFPQPSIANYKSRTVEVVRRKVSESDVETAIGRLREQKGELKKIEDRTAAQKGDVVALSVSVQAEGEEASRPEPFVDELGAGKLPAEVEDQIVGMESGANKEIVITGGEEHPQEQLRGRKITYTVTLHGLFEKKLPEMDEAFIKSLDLGASTIEELTAKVREKLEEQAANEARLDAQEAILNLLVKEHQFAVPQVMIDNEIRGMVARYGMAGNRQLDPDQIPVERFREGLQDHALERIRCSIIVDRIAEQEAIQVDDADKERLINEVAQRNGTSADQARKALLDKDRIMTFLLEARRTKALEFLVGQTQVSYKDEAPEQAVAA